MTYNRQEEVLFRQLISELAPEKQGLLNWMYAHSSIIAQLEQRREMERMKREITEEVLSRISALFETGDAVKEINALNKALEQLDRSAIYRISNNP